ncbi:Uma2 family endonuclease [Actinomadura sp. WMMB 499]|uniref:Uma2 family endonuclease n=1 Tax=Actinomadura sp. WMMB 499 TaxID=1219491 RepID=UPI0034A0C3C6
MSAQSVELYAESGLMDVESLPDWVIPPPGGFTADQFLDMRGLPRHTELIDGSLVFVSPQTVWHAWAIMHIVHELSRQAPPELEAVNEMTVRLSQRQAPEPDVSVIRAEVLDLDRTHFESEDVVLAVEAVSPDSVERDREIKPRRYAAAGIRHYWRMEKDGDRTVVYVYVLDPVDDAYHLTGIHHGTLKVAVPFEIEIDLNAIDRRGRGNARSRGRDEGEGAGEE